MNTREDISQLIESYKDNYKISDVVYYNSSKFLTVDILCRESTDIEKQKEIQQKIRTALGLDISINFKFFTAIESEDYYSYKIITFAKSEFNYDIDDKDIDIVFSSSIDITIKIDATMLQKLKLFGLNDRLFSHLRKYTFKDINLKFTESEQKKSVRNNEINSDNLLESRVKLLSEGIDELITQTQRVFNISNLDIVVGKSFTDKAVCINKIKEITDFIQVAGKIKYVAEKTFKKKTEVDGQTVEEEKVFYTFELNDGFGKIRGSYFPTKMFLEKNRPLEDNQIVTFCGKIDNYNDRLNLKVKEIAYCDLPSNQIVEEIKPVQVVESEQKPVVEFITTVPETYTKVFPQKYEKENQIDLFEAFASNKKIPTRLQGCDFVVFDLETTGLEYSSNEIIEIGAVKIRNGNIIETFNTLIKPDKTKISEFITELTGISEDMVQFSPAFKDIVADFYKFTRNSVLVAHNADFDKLFLSYHASLNGYLFDNTTLDTLAMAKKLISGTKNYKLGTIAKYLGVQLDQAHRALFDTIATAECFIKLCELEDK